MKANQKNKTAREKYLSFDPLDKKDELIIEKDLRSPEYKKFKESENSEILIPENYSSEKTFTYVKEKIEKKPKQAFSAIMKIAASVAVIVGISLASHLYFGTEKQLVVSTGIGETKEIVLSDNSKITLNSQSSLSYPSKFAKDKRLVQLSGEALFEIAKNPGKPFFVETSGLEIQVLGTIFNVKSYNNEDLIETALLEGTIAISLGEKQTILIPGEIAFFNKENHSLLIEKREIDEINSWKDNKLVFHKTPLAEIFRALERRENIQIVFNADYFKDIKITARFIHNETVEEVLNLLSETGNFRFEKQERKFIIHPNTKQ